MPSSLFGKARLRLLDTAFRLLRRPNRVDVAASVSPLARITASSLHGPVRIEEYVRLHRVEISGPVGVGRNSSLWGPGIHVLTRTEPVEIGNFCSIARNVSVHGYLHDHQRISSYHVGRNILGRPIEEELVSRGPTRVGHDVWIGAGSHVMAGVEIGDGAVIGAGSVVTRDIPPYAVAVGTPAEAVRFRFSPEIIRRLQNSRWWEWSHEEIREREGLFLAPLTQELLDRYLDS